MSVCCSGSGQTNQSAPLLNTNCTVSRNHTNTERDKLTNITLASESGDIVPLLSSSSFSFGGGATSGVSGVAAGGGGAASVGVTDLGGLV